MLDYRFSIELMVCVQLSLFVSVYQIFFFRFVCCCSCYGGNNEAIMASVSKHICKIRKSINQLSYIQLSVCLL